MKRDTFISRRINLEMIQLPVSWMEEARFSENKFIQQSNFSSNYYSEEKNRLHFITVGQPLACPNTDTSVQGQGSSAVTPLKFFKMVGFVKSDVEPTLKVKFFSAGLAACVGDLVTFPLDMAKVRLQIQGEGCAASAMTAVSSRGGTLALAGPGMHHIRVAGEAVAQQFKYRGVFGTIMTISREEGPRALYNGLCPGLQRQMCFASVRIGLYDTIKGFYVDLLSQRGINADGNIGLRIVAGITTGAMAVGCAQPTDVVKVRMQAQGAGGTAKRYTGAMHAYRTIAVEEGLRGLWKGTAPNITRNSVVNATELVSYDLIKEQILKSQLMTDNVPCHFVSAFGAGFCTTVVASPVDVVKTRFMNSGNGVYRGALHCAARMYNEGGMMAFYKGFVPSFMRLGSWNVVMFVCFEQLKRGFTLFGADGAPMVKQISRLANNKKDIPASTASYVRTGSAIKHHQ